MIEYVSSDQTFGTSHNKLIQNVLREQLFIELLVAMLMETFPKLKDLNELKATEISYKNRKRKSKNDTNQKEEKSETCKKINFL